MNGRDQGAAAGGFASVLSAAEAVTRKAGLVRGARTLLRMNQESGFDCPGCAWPDPEGGGAIEFCENGAKHLAHEATRRRVGPEFFSKWSVSRLLEQPNQWLEEQGRLTCPVWKRVGSDHYQPIEWTQAFSRIAGVLGSLDSPHQAIFYTSGRTSNEAAFLYQLFVRQFGTNNLPDCSNMCHESSGTALSETIGVGKGTVSLADFAHADAIFLLGQNPGTNHPRMMTTLEAAKRRGCRIVAVNPLRERALVRFAHPQQALELMGLTSTAIADLFLQVRVGGDVALLKGVMKEVLENEARAPRRVLDWDFLRDSTLGFDEFRDALEAERWEDLVEQSGISRQEMRQAAEIYCAAERVIVCWAMGLTQHRHGVANVQEIVNLLLLRGNLGLQGAGACPVRGHSNVQGDRTMGIWERPAPGFLQRLGREFDFAPPSAHGFDSVAAIRALYDGRAQLFFGLGGNFAVATPDATYTEQALRRCRLTAHVSTTLNRSHLVAGQEALILPCLARSERDVAGGIPQFVTIEDSMAVVRRSQGQCEPASSHLRSEVAIVAGLARAVLGEKNPVPWEALAGDYDRIREHIANVVSGFGQMNRRVREHGGMVLPVLPAGGKRRIFATASRRAHFTVHKLPQFALEPDQFLLTTLRSHDQFNTTIYSEDDRYRGIRGGRRVVFLHPEDVIAQGLRDGDRVDLTSHFAGEKRTVYGFRVVAYDLPRGCAAAYFPEANPLVPVGSVAEKSRTPTYKSIVISLLRSGDEPAPARP
ncbi:MAG TPA: FdhF/YdeP family oxidoreductase [Myxococcota bacterium]|nr:FdhF/YdeP family oxidoreductase [Myxococcota bacterium]